MKRLCLLLMLGLASTMAFGVKSYVYMIQTSSGCSLWGDIPDGMDINTWLSVVYRFGIVLTK